MSASATGACRDASRGFVITSRGAAGSHLQLLDFVLESTGLQCFSLNSKQPAPFDCCFPSCPPVHSPGPWKRNTQKSTALSVHPLAPVPCCPGRTSTPRLRWGPAGSAALPESPCACQTGCSQQWPAHARAHMQCRKCCEGSQAPCVGSEQVAAYPAHTDSAERTQVLAPDSCSCHLMPCAIQVQHKQYGTAAGKSQSTPLVMICTLKHARC